MRFLSAIALVAALAVSNAQDLDLAGIPQCALGCFATALPGSGCGITDAVCQCTTGRPAITKSIQDCVPGKCSDDDINKIAPAVQGICARAGVTFTDLPTGSASAGSNPSATGSGRVTGVSGSPTALGTPAPQNTGGAVANVAGIGAVVLGLAAVFGI